MGIVRRSVRWPPSPRVGTEGTATQWKKKFVSARRPNRDRWEQVQPHCLMVSKGCFRRRIGSKTCTDPSFARAKRAAL